MRYYFLDPISGVNYGYMLHAHSHLAFLGWVFMALYILITYVYLPFDFRKRRKYANMFIFLQVANMGMLFTFPFMGYAFWSILFSAIHALLAMFFARVFVKDTLLKLPKKHQFSFSFVKWGLILMAISNLAPFALGPVSATQGKGDLYYLLIYFYLHFQYNGWFTFALLGLMFWLLEDQGISTKSRMLRIGFYLKLFAVFPAYILSTLWTDPHPIMYVLGGLAALMQTAGLFFLLRFLLSHIFIFHKEKRHFHRILFWVGSLAIITQHVLIVLSAVPSLSVQAFTRNVVIAYLHLVLIGFVSTWILHQFFQHQFILKNTITKLGIGLFLAAFIFTEIILIQQSKIENASFWLFVLALMQLCGILSISVNLNRKIES